MLISAAYAAIAVIASTTGVLPQGRWPVVHLFTLGVMTNLVVAFSQQFGRAVTRSEHRLPRHARVLLHGGVAAVIAGVTLRWPWALAAGATAVTASVTSSYRTLRRMRRSAPAARFTWLIRTYERAHGAFLHGAMLGVLLGLGLLPGTWHATARLAHLHVLVAGWLGLTLLATTVFFGPAMLRTRIPTAEAQAVPAIRRAATALTIAVLALLGSALPPPWGAALRVLAAAGLAVYLYAVIVVGRYVLMLRSSARPTPARPLLVASSAWFALVLAADTLVVAVGAWGWLDELGMAFALGVAGQAVLAVILHLVPSLRGQSFAARDALIARTERGATIRASAINLAAAAVVAGTALHGSAGAVLWRSGWILMAAVVATIVLIAIRPVRGTPDVASTVARRHRTLPVVERRPASPARPEVR